MVGRRNACVVSGLVVSSIASCADIDPIRHADDLGDEIATSSSSSSGTGAGADDDEPHDDDEPQDDEPVAEDDQDAACTTMRRAPADDRIALDVEIACTHTEFAAWGASVVVHDDALLLAASAFYDAWVFHIDDATIDTRRSAPKLPAQRPHLAADERGRIYVAGLVDETTRVSIYDGEWTSEDVIVPGEHEIVGIDARGDDDATVWIVADDEELRRIYRSDAKWIRGNAAPVRPDTSKWFDRAHDGTELAWELTPHVPTNAFALEARFGAGKVRSLGGATPQLWSAVRSSTFVARTPELVTISAQVDGLQVQWADDQAVSSAIIPGTELRQTQCARDESSGSCPDPCNERSRGLDGGAFAATRTSDGTTWIAFVESFAHFTVRHEQTCDDVKGSCVCTDEVTNDSSTRELVVVAVGTQGDAREELRLPLGEMGSDPPQVAVHAAGTRLAIATTVDHSDITGTPAIRTLLVDTGRAGDWAD
jgi:hypothetical protein